MKFTKFSAVLGALLLLCSPAFAGGNGFNFFEEPRTVCVDSPRLISAASTNNFIDLRMFCGVAKLDIIGCTNAPSTATGAVFGSADGTTWSVLTNVSIAVPTVINYTNSTTVATNQYLLPGSIVTPTASTAGFASSYMSAPTYASTATFTMTNQPISIGFNVDSCPRYLRIGWTATASTSIGAYLTARPAPWSP